MISLHRYAKYFYFLLRGCKSENPHVSLLLLTPTILLTPDVWVFPTLTNSPTPPGCPTVKFNFDSKGVSADPVRPPPTSDDNRKQWIPRLPTTSVHLAIHRMFLQPPPGDTCQSSSWDPGKQFADYCRFITIDIFMNTMNSQVERARSGRGLKHKSFCGRGMPPS